MSNFFNEIFGRPFNLRFQTPYIKDMFPCCWTKPDTGYRCTARTVGVNDVTLTIEDDYSSVQGTNDIEGQTYSTEFNLPISKDVLAIIKEIQHKTVAGITIIDLIVDESKKPQIKIVKV